MADHTRDDRSVADVGRVSAPTTRVLLAVMALHAERRRPTLRSVAARVGCTSGTVHYHLRQLRALGLVDWCDGRYGTLVPLVAVVAVPGGTT